MKSLMMMAVLFVGGISDAITGPQMILGAVAILLCEMV